MVKVANSPNLIKLANPARMHLSNEDELMVVLQLQEPPSVDVSVIEQAEESKQEREDPTEFQKVGEKPAKTGKKAAQKQQQKKQTAPDAHEEKKTVRATPIPTPMTTTPASCNQIVVVFPIGVPGMGKTHFADTVLRPSFAQMGSSQNLLVIQNDLIKEQCMEQWRRENPRKPISEGLKVTAKPSMDAFTDKLNEAVRKLASSKSNDIKMIYLDKNYPPREIKLTLQAIHE